MGDISSSLFGTATSKDVDILKRHILSIKRGADAFRDEFQTFGVKFQSYMTKTSHREDLMEKATILNQELINMTFIEGQISQAIVVADLTKWINLLHMYGTQYVSVLLNIATLLHQEADAIETLLRGYLPAFFVPPEILAHVTANITQSLQDRQWEISELVRCTGTSLTVWTLQLPPLARLFLDLPDL